MRLQSRWMACLSLIALSCGADADDGVPVGGALGLAGGELYVDAAASPSGADGTEAHPFVTILDAVAAAGPGTTILVRPGNYVEATNIVLTQDGQRLLAPWSGPQYDAEDFLTGFANPTVVTTPAVPPTSNPGGHAVIEAQANDVEVAGFTVRPPFPGSGVRVGNPYEDTEGAYIHDNLIGAYVDGTLIQVNHSNGFNVIRASGRWDHNTDHGPSNLGSYNNGADWHGNHPAEMRFTRNDFRNARNVALCFQFAVTNFDLIPDPPPLAGAANVTVSNNRLRDTEVPVGSTGAGAGITIVFHSAPTISDPAFESFFQGRFFDNDISGNQTYGIWVSAGATFTIGGTARLRLSGNDIYDNTLGDGAYSLTSFFDSAPVAPNALFAPDSLIRVDDPDCDVEEFDVMNGVDNGSRIEVNHVNFEGVHYDVSCPGL